MRSTFIKHDKYRDVCCLVLKHFDTGSKHKLKIEWWNLGYVNSYNMGITQNIILTYDEMENWSWADSDFGCLRYKQWNRFR